MLSVAVEIIYLESGLKQRNYIKKKSITKSTSSSRKIITKTISTYIIKPIKQS